MHAVCVCQRASTHCVHPLENSVCLSPLHSCIPVSADHICHSEKQVIKKKRKKKLGTLEDLHKHKTQQVLLILNHFIYTVYLNSSQ